MFFGIGSYGVAIDAPTRSGRRRGRSARRPRRGLVLTGDPALAIGLFSLRVQTIFFAMVTLAVASAFAVLPRNCPGSPAARTGAPSRVPEMLRRASNDRERPVGHFGQRAHARLLSRVLQRSRFFSGHAAAHRRIALRARPAGDPRKSVPREALGYRIIVTAPSPTCSARCSPPAPARSTPSGCATRAGHESLASTS